jgi:hypothetical protein
MAEPGVLRRATARAGRARSARAFHWNRRRRGLLPRSTPGPAPELRGCARGALRARAAARASAFRRERGGPSRFLPLKTKGASSCCWWLLRRAAQHLFSSSCPRSRCYQLTRRQLDSTRVHLPRCASRGGALPPSPRGPRKQRVNGPPRGACRNAGLAARRRAAVQAARVRAHARFRDCGVRFRSREAQCASAMRKCNAQCCMRTHAPRTAAHCRCTPPLHTAAHRRCSGARRMCATAPLTAAALHASPRRSPRPHRVLIGFVYPAFASWKALESRKGESTASVGSAGALQGKDAWLIYWVRAHHRCRQ